MNVRYYLAKAEDALAILLATHGVSPRRPRTQHIRYHRESRAGTPLAIRGGFLRAGAEAEAYFEFFSPHDGVIRATLISSLHEGDAFTAPCVELPKHGAPRGLPAVAPAGGASLAAAKAAGLMPINLGIVREEQLDADGALRPHQVIGIVSDGVAHLMMHITPARGHGAIEGGIGGAALEQRLHFSALPRLGDVVTVYSGVMSASDKTMRFVHWLLNARTGAVYATCEVVAVAFDLTARKAVPVSDEVRGRIEAMRVGVTA